MNRYSNFRDMGGLVCRGGVIRKGMIFRSPVLFAETDEERDFIDGIGADVIFDFRSAEETADKPDYVPEGTEYVNLPVLGDSEYRYITVSKKAKLRCALLRGKRAEIIVREKLQSYREMPFSECYGEVFSAMDEGKKFVFHCTEGKDRTGVCAALIEYCLGRDRGDILAEYLASNIYRPAKDRRKLKYIGVSEKMLACAGFAERTHEELFAISENAVLKRFGSVGEYLYETFGITEERMENWRKLYLE